MTNAEELAAVQRLDTLHWWMILARMTVELDASPVNVARWRFCVRRYEAAVVELAAKEAR